MKPTNLRRYLLPAKILMRLVILLVMASMILSACRTTSQLQTPGPDETPDPTLRATRRPTITPTVDPLGSPNNPFVLAVVSDVENDQVTSAVEETARLIAELTGYVVTARVFSSYPALLEVMASGRAHIAWLPPLTYLYASRRGLAEVVLLTNHFGVFAYGTQFMANVETGFTPYYDPISGLNSADAATALGQFQNRRPCWVEPLSPSGYILPAGLMATNQIPALPAVLTQSHTATVRTLYIKGVCDFGATFSISGDPRTSVAVLDDLPDAMDRVLIIWRSDGVIPNVNLSLLAGLSEKERQSLTTAILDIARTPEGKTLLSYAAGDYQIDDIKPIDDSFYSPLRNVVDALNINLNDLVGK